VAEPAGSAAEALQEITRRQVPGAPPPRILIGGSLYFAGNVLADNGTPPT
jgi:dihydrofolate synthase/folylpolyglutamate synthase